MSKIKFIILLTTFIPSLYLHANNSWIQRKPLPSLVYHTGGFVIGDTAYVGLGFTGSYYDDNFYKYSINEDKWYSISHLPGRGRLSGAVFSIGNFGYVCAGWTGDSPSAHLKDCYKYDPTTGKWSQIADYPGYATDDVQSFVINGKAYVCGGYNIATPINETWEYDPINDTWTRKAFMIDGIARGVGFAIGKYGYVVCGAAGKSYRNAKMYRYDPDADKWDDLGLTPLDSCLFPFALVNGPKAYIGGGWVENSSQFWEFDAEKRMFRKMTSLPAQIYGCTTFNLGGRLFVQTGSSWQFNRLMEYMPSNNYICVDSLSSNIFCEDSTHVKVYFSYDGDFNTNNEFRLELTSSIYSYSDSVILSSSKTSPLEFELPENFQDGYQYALRVNSTSPKTYGNYFLPEVIMLHYPPDPIIELKNDTIFIKNYGYNVWYKDGIPYDTTTTRFLKVTEPGVYKLYVGRYCSSGFSNEIDFQPSCVYFKTGDEFGIYPNPAADYIIFTNKGNNFGRAIIFSSIGMKVLEAALDLPIDVSTLPAGLYYLNHFGKIFPFLKY